MDYVMKIKKDEIYFIKPIATATPFSDQTFNGVIHKLDNTNLLE
jgi:hypothetical protein